MNPKDYILRGKDFLTAMPYNDWRIKPLSEKDLGFGVTNSICPGCTRPLGSCDVCIDEKLMKIMLEDGMDPAKVKELFKKKTERYGAVYVKVGTK